MADRPTSHAKSVEGLHHEESALDRAQALRQQFDRALNDNQRQHETVKETQKDSERPGSPMVRGDAPVLRPTPSGPMRDIPDRQANAIRLAREHEAARQAAADREQAQKARSGKSRDHDRDR